MVCDIMEAWHSAILQESMDGARQVEMNGRLASWDSGGRFMIFLVVTK